MYTPSQRYTKEPRGPKYLFKNSLSTSPGCGVFPGWSVRSGWDTGYALPETTVIKTASFLQNGHTRTHAKPAALEFLFPRTVSNILPIFTFLPQEYLISIGISPSDW